MTGKSRFSIATLMIVILVVAVDFGLGKLVWPNWGKEVLMVLPMINLLLFCLPRLRRGRKGRCFWVGFEGVGWAMMGSILLMIWLRFEPVIYLFYAAFWTVSKLPIDKAGNAADMVAIGFFIPISLIPLVLVASIGGWLSNRYRVVIERRPEGVEPRQTSFPSSPTIGDVSLETATL